VIIGHQDWSDLLFLHFRMEAGKVRPLVHDRLLVDEREGSAWISMTPFTLRNGQVRGLPAVPPFHELNLRTYVTHPRHGPGIWFFSLDAQNAAAVLAARVSVRLPYFWASMRRSQGSYRSDRVLGPGHFQARWSVGESIGRAAPGSLEEFLVERYVLYSRAAGPLLWRGPVRHEPWPLHAVKVEEVAEDLSVTQGLPRLGEPALAQWSAGVSVDFEHFRLC
jgi:uncharacterized protein YqjF (DUF2071 family)